MDPAAFKAMVDAATDVTYRGKQLTRGHAEAVVAAVVRAQAQQQDYEQKENRA